MNVAEGYPETTILADLTCADHVPSDTFDCVIFTQSLQMIYDLKAALWHLHRIIKPGGVLLVTGAGINRIGRRLGPDPWGEYWHFTTQSMENLLQESFPGGEVVVRSYGNVFAALCVLHGISAEEVGPGDLDYHDPDFEVLVTARAMKNLSESANE